MPGSDAVIGLPDEGTALEYDMDGYSQPVESAEQVRHRCGRERVCVVVLLLLAIARAKRLINETAARHGPGVLGGNEPPSKKLLRAVPPVEGRRWCPFVLAGCVTVQYRVQYSTAISYQSGVCDSKSG